MPSRPSRLACVDALKAISCQLIVLHHLAFYGPMSHTAHSLAPDLFDFLCQHARIAVQVFLVVSGFLAARSLAPAGALVMPRPWQVLTRRYRKLVVPFAAAMLLAICGAALARTLMTHDSIPASPTLYQLLAHVLLVHNLLDVDALSAGVWYIAIDLQLFALLAMLLWAGRAAAPGRVMAAVVPVGMLVVASLFWFNLDAEWDIWAVYFFGAYGLGAMAYWATAVGSGWRARAALAVLGIVVLAALWVDFRSRIAVAVVVALVLGAAQHGGWLERWPRGRVVAWFGKISYSVFLVHFPVCLVINGVVSRLAPDEPWLNAFGIVIAWLASNTAGALFYRHVERVDLVAAVQARCVQAVRSVTALVR